ncbi:MAG: hypothetical protein K6E68_08525 [Lachnospiraceae bacterium]|nr:hypothetical protein [Lachnospiraceae bacterium]
MELVGELKSKVEKTENLDEAKKMIEDAGMILDDAELNQVTGGASFGSYDRETRKPSKPPHQTF